MKNNTQKGSAKVIIVVLLALLVAAGGYIFYLKNDPAQNTEKEGTEVAESTLPETCVDNPSPGSDEYIPVITSISKTSGSVGTEVEINGCNFSGFEGDKNLWIENEEGKRGILYGYIKGSTEKMIKVDLVSPLCSRDPSYAGVSCEEFAGLQGVEPEEITLHLNPGEYKIYAEPWGNKSNEVSFIITE